jgi:hypothetical protein
VGLKQRRAHPVVDGASHLTSSGYARPGNGNSGSGGATGLGNPAMVLRDEGRLSAAEALMREALAVRQRMLGDHHPSVADSQRDLAALRALEHKPSGGQ